MRTPTRLLTALLLPAVALGLGACGQTAAPTANPPVIAESPATPGPSSTATLPTGQPAEQPTDDPAGATDAPVDEHTTYAAQLTGSSASVRATPDASGKVVRTLGATTALGSKTTLLVVDVQQGWVQVSLPTRPNGSTGWVQADQVRLRTNTMTIAVDRGAHTLTLTDAGQVVLSTPVAVGSKENPTPAGSFYVTDLVDTGNAGGAYGPFALGLSGHSDTLSEFGGGDGQLGLHGTNDPSSIGRSVSHGCVRVPNDVVIQLSTLVPLGTPVTVV